LDNAYGVLNRELGLPTPPRRPREFIAGHASALGVSSETERVGRRLVRRAAEAGLSNGQNPSGFAASCLAVAADGQGVDVRQSALADVADVSAATVRKHRDTIQAEFGEVGR
jgi:transcription initiation factor TFIIB